MCGICGSIGDISPDKRKLMLMLNQNRGTESVGILTREEGKWIRGRNPHSPFTTIGNRVFPETWWGNEILLCHNRRRSPSSAVTTKETCHPFKYLNIIGAHNGYVSNWKSIINKYKKEYPEVDNFTVDSQVIFFLIQKFGTEGLSQVEGKASVWWIDEEDLDYIYMWCWKQDLHFSESGGVSFSSEEEPLLAVGFKKVYKLDEDIGQVLRIDIKENKLFQIGAVEGKKYVSHSSAGGSHSSGGWLSGRQTTMPVVDIFTYDQLTNGQLFYMCASDACVPILTDELIIDDFNNEYCPYCYSPAFKMDRTTRRLFIEKFESEGRKNKKNKKKGKKGKK